MALTIKGTPSGSYTTQPNFGINEKNDGTLEGQVVYKGDRSNLQSFPQIGSAHPTDTRLEAYNREITYLPLEQVTVTVSYFGLTSKKTDPIISYTPNTNQEPITSHPNFADFAGTSAAPLNGATFDSETGEFLGFYDQDITDLFGVQFYLVPATMLSLTYWTSEVPSLGRRMTRKPSIPGFRKPSDVKEFLILDMPYRQVGSFYQVTEQIMGSGPNGFSQILYP